VVWFYASSNGTARVETRVDSVTNEYVLEMEWPNRPIAVERFSDVVAFDVRVRQVERQLETEGCRQLGRPDILPHGWRGPTH
jgi:hypothetical protein